MRSSPGVCHWRWAWHSPTRCCDQRRVTACYFGDGAVAEGAFHESLNMAALWQLPVLFCCENNLYAMGTALERAQSQTDLTVKAASYQVPTLAVDGMDVIACHEAARRGADHIRSTGGPFFIEFRTYRFRAHSMFDPELYRDKSEVERWRMRDPIRAFSERCLQDGTLTADDVTAIEAAAERGSRRCGGLRRCRNLGKR